MPQSLSRARNQGPTLNPPQADDVRPLLPGGDDRPAIRDGEPSSLTEHASVLVIVSCTAALAFVAVLTSGLLNAMVP